MRTDQPWREVACPRCSAQPGQLCRSASGKETNVHQARLAALVPVLTDEERAHREHEHRQFHAQYDARTMVSLTFDYTCGCSEGPSDPVPLKDANTAGVARAIICDVHDEYAVVRRVDTHLIVDRETLQRIFLAADIDPLTADAVATEQNEACAAGGLRR